MATDNESQQITTRRAAVEVATSRGRTRRSAKAGRTEMPNRDVFIGMLYARVSTKEQARTGGGGQGYSLPVQIDACRLKASQLGAVIAPEHEYVDAGESAKTADRDELQRMLRDIKTVRPDFVIVHKIDRLARNRADDIAINLALKKHRVQLVSCTENIDETPSGRLLYGLMAEIAQFYALNLAEEVLKGLVRKAEEGGTPFRAPLGYTNRRELRDGADVAWVEFDPERAELVRWCFEAYATGEWTGIGLTLAAEAKGLTSRPRGEKSCRPVTLTGMYHLLSNPYYMGVVSYRGIHYEGKHPVLVEPEVWLAVQDLLAANAHRGEKNRVHPHYLRSTIYCSSCGGRLIFSENTGNGGAYEYYVCVAKRKTETNSCTRRAVRVEKIEDGIAEFYRQFEVPAHQAEAIRSAVRAELAGQTQEAKRGLTRAKRKDRAQDERQKLLQAHYAGAIPADLLALEMNRLTRELAEVDVEIRAAKATNSEVEAVLDAALRAASHCERAYLTAPHQVRRQINQGFFEKLLIGEDGSVEEAELTEPFRPLVGGSARLALPSADKASADGEIVRESDEGEADLGKWAVGWDQGNTTDRVTPVGGVNVTYMVGLTGFEPATP